VCKSIKGLNSISCSPIILLLSKICNNITLLHEFKPTRGRWTAAAPRPVPAGTPAPAPPAVRHHAAGRCLRLVGAGHHRPMRYPHIAPATSCRTTHRKPPFQAPCSIYRQAAPFDTASGGETAHPARDDDHEAVRPLLGPASSREMEIWAAASACLCESACVGVRERQNRE
jgi:hypothetical protein